MKLIEGFSIKRKLILLQLLTTFTVLLFYSVFHVIRDTRQYLYAVHNEVSSITELVGYSCISSLHFLDKQAAENILNTLRSEENVLNAWLHNEDSLLFADYRKDPEDNYTLEQVTADSDQQTHQYLITSKSILSDDELIGFISIRYDLQEYRRIILKNTLSSLVIFLIGMTAAWLLAVFTQRTISNPVLKLVSDMKQISSTGDYGIRSHKVRNDELGLLTDGINEMLQQIQIRDEERNKANSALHESEEKYRNLVERANDGILILQNGLFKYVNPSLVKMAECKESELLGQPFVDFIAENHIKKIEENYRRRMAGEAVQAMYETRFKTIKGDYIDAEVNAGFIAYQGKPADLVIIRDITKRKKLERDLRKHQTQLEELVEERTSELAEANKRLMELDRLKSMFLASMSHELRTPLNSIIGFTGILLMGITGELNSEQKKQLEMVKSSASHLLELINDILDISKIESDRISVAVETFNVMDIVHEVAKSFQPMIERKKLELIVDGESPIEIESDRRRVKQILVNLAGNAVKFTEKGSIEIKAYLCKNNHVCFEIKDTGIGIQEDEIEKLFQPFQQIDMTSTKKYEGTGLGLYLTKKLVSLLHGNVSVSSEFGKGSVFKFYLPLGWWEK